MGFLIQPWAPWASFIHPGLEIILRMRLQDSLATKNRGPDLDKPAFHPNLILTSMTLGKLGSISISSLTCKMGVIVPTGIGLVYANSKGIQCIVQSLAHLRNLLV